MKAPAFVRVRSVRAVLRAAIVIGTCAALLVAMTVPAMAAQSRYMVTKLVSDTSAIAAGAHDPNLVNGWGLAAGPTTFWWVADNGTDLSTLYSGAGAIIPKVFAVNGGPTGIVFNPTTDFVVASPMPPAVDATQSAHFLWATEGGQILGWNPDVPSVGSTTAVVAADRSGVGAIYKGLAIGSSDGKNYIYATDFHNGRVDVFDGTFTLQSWSGAFRDRKIPRGYAPFGIQNLNGVIYVTYAKQDKAKHDEVDGQGLGFVDSYRPNGTFIRRVATRGSLNAPWGVAWSPSSFGTFGRRLLVGNFGSGKIVAYRMTSRHRWVPAGFLRDRKGHQIVIRGLWGIAFANGGPSGPTSSLFFAAGPGDESHGLFGSITKR